MKFICSFSFIYFLQKITEQLNSDQKVQLQNKELVTAVEKYFEGKLSAVEADELQFEGLPCNLLKYNYFHTLYSQPKILS